MKKRISHRFSFAGVILVALLLVGCNTMEGLGKDIQGLGRALEGKAAESDN